LVELLVVISIMGLIAALTVPALKNLGKSNIAVSAARQMLDDVGRARQLAISRHTTVYMVFVSTNFWTYGNNWYNNLSFQDLVQLTNLSESQLSSYNYVSYGALGDQPGKHQWNYLSTWQTLPENSFIAGWKFQSRGFPGVVVGNGSFTVVGFSTTTAIPFPTTNTLPSATIPIVPPPLPFIAFNYLGQLTIDGLNPSYTDEYIPLAQGSVGYGYNGATKSPTMAPVGASGVTESPSGNSTNSMFNLIHVDALTGRARLEFQQVQ
jgi:type II secretory pathway pseudopilin PulG